MSLHISGGFRFRNKLGINLEVLAELRFLVKLASVEEHGVLVYGVAHLGVHATRVAYAIAISIKDVELGALCLIRA